MTFKRKIVLAGLLTPVVMIGLVAALMAYLMFYGPPVPEAKPGTVRIACVGDSITFGLPFLGNRQYPPMLERMLGSDKYAVRNFGAPGFATQKASDHPYWQHRYFRLSNEFSPNIVIVMLGTNDSKTQNWRGVEKFATDYWALAQHYLSLPGRPRVILMTPPTAFVLPGEDQLSFDMNAAAIAAMSESVKQIGAELGLSVIDIHTVTASHPEFFNRDGIHPDKSGVQLIAQTVYDELMRRKTIQQPS